MNQLYSCFINNRFKSDQIINKDKSSNNTESHTIRNRLLSASRATSPRVLRWARHGSMQQPDSWPWWIPCSYLHQEYSKVSYQFKTKSLIYAKALDQNTHLRIGSRPNHSFTQNTIIRNNDQQDLNNTLRNSKDRESREDREKRRATTYEKPVR